MAEEVVSIFAGVRGYLDLIEVKDIQQFTDDYLRLLAIEKPDLLADVNKTGKLSEDHEKQLELFLTELCQSYAA